MISTMEIVARYSALGESQMVSSEQTLALLLPHSFGPLYAQNGQRGGGQRLTAATGPFQTATAAGTALTVNAELSICKVAAFDDLAKGQQR